jgi:hypothetical protein
MAACRAEARSAKAGRAFLAKSGWKVKTKAIYRKNKEINLILPYPVPGQGCGA